MPCINKDGYSITSPAVASSEGGIVRPSAAAVLSLTTSSNLTGGRRALFLAERALPNTLLRHAGLGLGFVPLALVDLGVAPNECGHRPRDVGVGLAEHTPCHD
jgi:hypothetical protein